MIVRVFWMIASVANETISWSGMSNRRKENPFNGERTWRAHYICLPSNDTQLSMMVIILITSMARWTRRENCNSSSYIESLSAWHANSTVIDFRYPRLSFGTLQLSAIITIWCGGWLLSCYSFSFCNRRMRLIKINEL